MPWLVACVRLPLLCPKHHHVLRSIETEPQKILQSSVRPSILKRSGTRLALHCNRLARTQRSKQPRFDDAREIDSLWRTPSCQRHLQHILRGIDGSEMGRAQPCQEARWGLTNSRFLCIYHVMLNVSIFEPSWNLVVDAAGMERRWMEPQTQALLPRCNQTSKGQCAEAGRTWMAAGVKKILLNLHQLDVRFTEPRPIVSSTTGWPALGMKRRGETGLCCEAGGGFHAVSEALKIWPRLAVGPCIWGPAELAGRFVAQ